MTFNEWLWDLVNPANLLTESIYNIIFEVVATWIFVRFAMKKIIKKELKKYDIEQEE
jgi:hypothetical protein